MTEAAVEDGPVGARQKTEAAPGHEEEEARSGVLVRHELGLRLQHQRAGEHHRHHRQVGRPHELRPVAKPSNTQRPAPFTKNHQQNHK